MSRPWQHQIISAYRLPYRRADRSGKGAALDEICARTGYHRKYAIQLLNRYETHHPPKPRGRPRCSSPVTDKVLGAVWYALGRPGAIQLQERMADGLEWARQDFQLSDQMERELLSMSVRTLDRRLEDFRKQLANRPDILKSRISRDEVPRRLSNGRYGVAWPRPPGALRRYQLRARRTRARSAIPVAKNELPVAQGEGRMSAEFTPRKQKDVMVVKAKGKMVAGDQAFRLMKLAIRTMNETDIRKFVVDLEDVTLIDSAGVGELVAVNSAVREKGGKLRLSNLEDSVGKVLQMALIHKIIPCFDTQKEAIASMADEEAEE